LQKKLCVALVFFGFGFLAIAQIMAESLDSKTSVEDSARLPVKRVVLYKNGVGYFEHSTQVRGSEDLAIDFTTAQLNDVLKSLTAVDLGDGHISGIRYNSIAPLNERLKALRLPFGEDVTRADFLSALRGAQVEVDSGSNIVTGRLLSVEDEQRTTDKGTTYQVTMFSVMTNSGEMRSFELSPSVSVQLAERDLREEVGRYLNLVGSSRARDLRRMTISDVGNSEREIFVSYISEVPVWKSTYRIILPEKASEKPLLQGWAIVDNTIGEDWKDVQLSLIAGSPQSFIQDISQPLYARRPVVALPESAMLTPQTHEATMSEEEKKAEAVSGTGGGVGSGSGAGFGVPGDFMGGLMAKTKQFEYRANSGSNRTNGAAELDRLEQYPQPQGAPAVKAPVLDQMAQQQNAQVAQAQDLGDYFEYNIKQNITISKNQSALVPILQSRIEAEKVTLWSPDNQRALRALWIKNASGQILDSGTFNIIDGDTFAGEGLIETVHPDERRLLSYAADTAVHVTSEAEAKDLPVSRIQLLKGVMFVSREQRNKIKYTVRNADTAARQVVIEHPVREGWKLVNDVTPKETSASHYRFRLAVDPNKTSELTVEEIHTDVTRTMLTDLTQDQVQILAVENRLTPELQQAFHQVLDQKNRISDLQSQLANRQRELKEINDDQARIRENMKALKGSAEEKALLQRYTHQLDTQEDRLTALHKEIADLSKRKVDEQQKLDELVQHISLT
jgi:hypothetical protein